MPWAGVALPAGPAPRPPPAPAHQVFVNFAKKQSDNLEQQETEPPSGLQSPLCRLLSLFRPRPPPTELRALVADEPEDLDTEDEGLISFEEERVSQGLGSGPRAGRGPGSVGSGGRAPQGEGPGSGWDGGRAREGQGRATAGRGGALDPGCSELGRGHRDPRYSGVEWIWEAWAQSGETDHADLLAPWKRRAFWSQAEPRWAEQSLGPAATGLAGADHREARH